MQPHQHQFKRAALAANGSSLDNTSAMVGRWAGSGAQQALARSAQSPGGGCPSGGAACPAQQQDMNRCGGTKGV